jgi:hypothetical protein
MNNTYEQIKQRAHRFVSRDLAIISAARAIKPERVMLGDDGKFWLVTPADASRLEAMGFEHAI